MKKAKSVQRTIVDFEGKERDKVLHEYTGEEIDQLWYDDPDFVNSLFGNAEVEAINNPANHNRSK